MPESSELERRLSAILSADVHGFSRLMGEDEPTTVRTMMEYRDDSSRAWRGVIINQFIPGGAEAPGTGPA